MKKYMILMVLAGALVCFSHGPGGADTSFRCANKIISTGDTMYYIRQVCGDPTSEQRVGERTTYSVQLGGDLKVKDEIYISEWVYQKDNGFYLLTFEGSRLVNKEYTRSSH